MSSLPRKRSKIRRFEAFQTFPQFIPDATNKKAIQEWYEQVKRTLQRINDDLAEPLDEAFTDIAALQSALADLKAIVDAIQPATPSGEQCCDELRAAIVLLQNRVTVLENATPSTSGIAGVEVFDEGLDRGQVQQFDFRGAGVTAVVSGGLATVTIPGLNLSGTFDIEDGDGTTAGTHIIDDGSP